MHPRARARRPISRGLPKPLRLLVVLAAAAYLGLLFYIPGVFVMYAVGPALFGGAIIAGLIVLQYPVFALCRRFGSKPCDARRPFPDDAG